MRGLAVYAGSFDPPTTGHLWMIEQGARLFEKLIVAVGINPEKRYAYALEQRLNWLRGMTSEIENVEVNHFHNLFLARYAAELGASYILRGVRSEADFGYERAMRHVNADLNPGVTTVFLMPPREFAEVSSSLVKGMIGPRGWESAVRPYLPSSVYEDVVRTHGVTLE